MARINYMAAWANLKDIIAAAATAGIPTMDTNAILCLIMNLEHPGLEWTKLDEILQHLKAPQRN